MIRKYQWKEWQLKSEARNPKPERRPKTEIRSSLSPVVGRGGLGGSGW